MNEHKWNARTKRDLIIEVWEALDCESVGVVELQAIEIVVRDRFGSGAVESHASVARLLADEGAELRHPEVLELDVLQRTSDPQSELFRDVLSIENLEQAAVSIIRLEDLRIRFSEEGDQTGSRRVREMAMKGKRTAQELAASRQLDQAKRAENKEIAEWFAVWLRQPEIFKSWLDLRRESKEFRENFGVR